MFISRFLQVVILAYLFNLLIVACSPIIHSSADTSTSIVRRYQLLVDCNNNLVEILTKRVRANRGQVAIDSAYSWLEVAAVNQNNHKRNVSLVTIRGNKSGMYLCFNKKLKLITRHNNHKTCQFREIYDSTGFTKFESDSYPGCYMAFNKNGKPFNNQHCIRTGTDGHKLRHHRAPKYCNRFSKRDPAFVHTDPKIYNEKG